MVNLLLHKITGRLFRKPQRMRLVIVARTLSESLPAYQARIPLAVKVLPPDVDETERCLAHIPPEHRPDIERRVRHGHLCCVAEHNGQIIYVSWIAFKICYSYLLDREYELADDEAYWYGAYALSAFRGNGVHPAVGCYILQLLKDRGCKRVLGFVEKENPAALHSVAKLGFKKVGLTGFIEVFGLRWYFHRDDGVFSALKRRNCWRKM